ncbi:hypothetical protein M9458_008289, partial [Cirrhinus mrigala]
MCNHSFRNKGYESNRYITSSDVMGFLWKTPQPEPRYAIEVQMLTGKHVSANEAQYITFPTPYKPYNGPIMGAR